MNLDQDMVTIVSQEDEQFQLPRSVAKRSELIKNMIDDGDDEVVPLPNITSTDLTFVIDYLYHFADGSTEPTEIPKPLPDAELNFLSEWEKQFLDSLDQYQLFQVILGADYLNIPSLLDLTCAKIASFIKGKTPEEIRQMFNIVNDFTPEEEAQIREENKWIEEIQ